MLVNNSMNLLNRKPQVSEPRSEKRLTALTRPRLICHGPTLRFNKSTSGCDALSPETSSRYEYVAPPTVSETKKKLLSKFTKPLNGVYNEIIDQLLVQQHFIRYRKDYHYNEISALGLVSLFELVFESLDEADRRNAFDAFIEAHGEAPETYRSDAAKLEADASALSSADDLVPDRNGPPLQRLLALMAEPCTSPDCAPVPAAPYSQFLAVGLFRLYEKAGARSPKALKSLAELLRLRPERVMKDLRTYRGVLSRLSNSVA